MKKSNGYYVVNGDQWSWVKNLRAAKQIQREEGGQILTAEAFDLRQKVKNGN